MSGLIFTPVAITETTLATPRARPSRPFAGSVRALSGASAEAHRRARRVCWFSGLWTLPTASSSCVIPFSGTPPSRDSRLTLWPESPGLGPHQRSSTVKIRDVRPLRPLRLLAVVVVRFRRQLPRHRFKATIGRRADVADSSVALPTTATQPAFSSRAHLDDFSNRSQLCLVNRREDGQ